MRSVWKFPLVTVAGRGVEIRREILMPEGSHVVSVHSSVARNEGDAFIVVYAFVDTAQNDAGNYEMHRFQVVGTGHDAEEGCGEDDVLEFLGTVTAKGFNDTGFFHVFEVRDQKQMDGNGGN